jgi:hypothetical protein
MYWNGSKWVTDKPNSEPRETISIPKNVVAIAIESTIYPRDKSAYERRWTFPVNKAGQASFYWAGLNIGNGYQGRLCFIYRNGRKRVVWRKYS